MICIIALLVVIATVGCSANDQKPTLSPIPHQTPTPTQTPAPTPDLFQQAENRLHQYFSYLLEGSYEEAASLLSTSAGLERESVAQMWNDLHEQGWRLINYQIVQKQLFDSTRLVFHVQISQSGIEPEQYESAFVMRLEEDGYWYFAAGVLDHLTLRQGAKTVNNVTITAGLFERGVDTITIWLNINNSSDNSVIWDSSECATLYFDNKLVFANCPSAVRIEPGASVNVPIIFAINAFEQPRNIFPTKINISSMKWDADDDGSPNMISESWEYHILLTYVEP